MTQIQRQYRRYQQRGLPGSIAHPNEPYAFDEAESAAGVTLVPGDGVYLDASGNWIKPVSAATRVNVTHIVSYDQTSFNVDIASPTLNQSSQVQFAAGSNVKAAAYGVLHVTAGADVVKGTQAIYDETDGRWITYSPTAGTIADFRSAVFVFLSSGGDGDPVKVRHSGRAQR